MTQRAPEWNMPRVPMREEPSDAARRAHREELTPISFLERSMLVYPDRVAISHEDRRYTYREFGERVNRLASALSSAGLESGDRVAYVCPNIPAVLVSWRSTTAWASRT